MSCVTARKRLWDNDCKAKIGQRRSCAYNSYNYAIKIFSPEMKFPLAIVRVLGYNSMADAWRSTQAVKGAVC